MEYLCYLIISNVNGRLSICTKLLIYSVFEYVETSPNEVPDGGKTNSKKSFSFMYAIFPNRS